MFETFLLLTIILVQILLFVIILLVMYFLFFGIFSVPYVRTSTKKGRAMLELAGLQKGERVVDFGSGDGALVFEASKMGASGTGVEARLPLVIWSRFRKRLGGHNAVFHHGDMFKVTPPEADVITSYLFTRVNEKLEPILKKHYPSGTRVVSRVFRFPNLPLEKEIEVGGDVIRLYRLP